MHAHTNRTLRSPCRRLGASALVLVASGGAALAHDDEPATDLDEAIVVVANRSPAPEARVVPWVTSFDASDVERRQATRVDELLREVPGVLVVRDGPVGQFSRVFVRGAASTQTLFVVDGVPQNDATTGGGFDLNDLGTAAVERIEVLRGSYGVLYGSEAIGGVVSVTTRRGRGPGSGFVRVEGGSFGTRRGVAGFGAANDDLDLAVTLSDERSDGPEHREAAGLRDATARLGVRFSRDVELDVTARNASLEVESPFDFASSGVLPEDENIDRARETTSFGATLTVEAHRALTVRAHASYLRVDSDFDNGPDGVELVDPDFTPGTGDEVRVVRDELRARNRERDLRARIEATWRAGDALRWARPEEGGVALDVTAGAETLAQDARSTSTFPDFAAPTSTTQVTDDLAHVHSGFVLAEAALPDAGPFARGVLAAGVRRDAHDDAGRANSPYYGARVDLAPTGTTLRGAYGEGFRAPKPSELFDPFAGFAGLGPETSRSIDAGFAQELLDGDLRVEGTWFELRVDDLIAYDVSFTPPGRPFGALRNVARARTRGTEWAARWNAGAGFRVRGSYTHQDPEDLSTGDDLPNRVRSYGSLGVAWERGPWSVGLDGAASGRSRSQGGEFTAPDRRARERPGRLRLVTLTARYRWEHGLTFFARVENLLDDESVATPTSPRIPGTAAYAGVLFEF